LNYFPFRGILVTFCFIFEGCVQKYVDRLFFIAPLVTSPRASTLLVANDKKKKQIHLISPIIASKKMRMILQNDMPMNKYLQQFCQL